MSLRFTLADRQLRLFRCGLQSLQKIGAELLLEALPARVSGSARRAAPGRAVTLRRPPPAPPARPHCAQLILRAINSSRSAYMSVTYDANFFHAYDVFDCNLVQAGLVMKVSGGRAAAGHAGGRGGRAGRLTRAACLLAPPPRSRCCRCSAPSAWRRSHLISTRLRRASP